MSEYLTSEFISSLLLGISLAACAGFRIFLPLSIVSLAIHSQWLTVHPTFQWLASSPVFIFLLFATFAEIAGSKRPRWNDTFAVFAAPLSALAGTILASAVLVGIPMQWRLVAGLVVGGIAACAVYRMTALVRVGSSRFTGGIANQFISKIETTMAIVSTLASIFLPTLAFVSFVIFCLISYKLMKLIKNAQMMTMQMHPRGVHQYQEPEEREMKTVYPAED